MTTINAKELKNNLKEIGVKVLRSQVYKGGVILTIGKEFASSVEQYLESKNIACVRPMNQPIKAKANILGYADAAEFTSLFQL